MKLGKLDKRNIFGIVVFLAFIILYLIYNLFLSDIQLKNSNENIKSIESINLTEKQKLDDFEYLYDVMLTSQPMLNDYEKLYGISFKNNKDYYIEQIKNTKNDYEFYCVISSILNDIPSCHTYVTIPNYSKYLGERGFCYNSCGVLEEPNLEAYTNYWNSVCNDNYTDYLNDQYILFTYINAEYVLNDTNIPNENGIFILNKINNIKAEDYLLNELSGYSLRYNYVDKKAYKEYCFLTKNKTGKKISASFISKDGFIYEDDDYYLSCYSDLAYIFKSSHNYTSSSTGYVINKDYYSHIDMQNDIGYIHIQNFNNKNGNALLNEIISIKNNNIIIDIRNNYGGNLQYINSYVYPALFAEDSLYERTINIPLSKNNKKVYNDFLDSLIDKGNIVNKKSENAINGYKTIYKKEILKMNGMSDSRNIYILVSNDTASAADAFASIAKQNNLGLLIGDNTKGEGLSGTYMMDILPESKIVYLYTCSKALNPDGTDNSLFGTSPDVYISLSNEGYLTKIDYLNNGLDPYTYENRLIWDDVLIKTLEIIKEKENE